MFDKQILRFAQDDRVNAQDDRVKTQNERVNDQKERIISGPPASKLRQLSPVEVQGLSSCSGRLYALDCVLPHDLLPDPF